MRSLTFFAILLILLGLVGCTAAETSTTEHRHEESTSTEAGHDSHDDGASDHVESSASHDDEHGDGGHNSAESIPGAAEIRIIATEFGFEPTTIDLVAGEPVNIVLVNEGAIEHELVIKELNFHAHAEAGETVTVGFTADETGEYEFGCYIAGHYEAGMFGETIIGN